jgi:hypothetical protein
VRSIDGNKSFKRQLEHLHDNNATSEVEEPVLVQDQAEEELVGDTIVVDVPGIDNFYSSNSKQFLLFIFTISKLRLLFMRNL